MKSYSQDLRERVVAGRQSGQSAEELARQFRVSKRTVERYWKQQRETGDVTPQRVGGHRVSRLAKHEETLRAWIREQADLTLEELRARVHKKLGIKMCLSGLWYRLEKLGLSFKKNAARRRAGTRGSGRGAARLATRGGNLGRAAVGLSG
jgi:transposase